MSTYKDAFKNLVNDLKANDLLDYVFYDFSNKVFAENAGAKVKTVLCKGEQFALDLDVLEKEINKKKKERIILYYCNACISSNSIFTYLDFCKF